MKWQAGLMGAAWWRRGLGLGAWAIAGATAVAANDYRATLLQNSPFGGEAGAVAQAGAGDWEFRAVVRDGSTVLVNLSEPGAARSHWLTVNEAVGDLQVQAYEAATEEVVVMRAGRMLRLPLKQARVVRVVTPAVAEAAAGDQARPARAGERGEGQPADLRDLPPETQRVLEQVRRRRAQRAEERGGAVDSAETARPEPR